jgi:hypothetical protein
MGIFLAIRARKAPPSEMVNGTIKQK